MIQIRKNDAAATGLMFNRESLSIPSVIIPANTHVLTRRVGALRLLDEGNGRGRLGELVELGPGIPVSRCGPGYNERTTKICCGGEFYFIFLEDLVPSTPQTRTRGSATHSGRELTRPQNA